MNLTVTNKGLKEILTKHFEKQYSEPIEVKELEIKPYVAAEGDTRLTVELKIKFI